MAGIQLKKKIEHAVTNAIGLWFALLLEYPDLLLIIER